MNLPGKGVSQKRSEAGALIAQEYFPSLGEEAPTPKPVERVAKPIEKSAEKSTDKVSFGTQPPKFMTSKKIERSEQPPLQSTQTSSPPLQTQTQTHTITTTTTTTSEAPKFKFGSDRPTFSSSKTGEKKQIVKTEEELKREEREREIEERLAKDKEEELKRRDERLAKKAKREEETGVKTDTVPTTTTAPTVTVTEGEKKDSEKKERLGFSNFKRKEINAEVNKEEIKQEIKQDSTNGQETQTKLVKKNPKPKNNDENGEHKEKRAKKPRDEKPEPPKEDEVKEEVKPAQAHDVIAVTATSTTASWDIGLKKIPKKKT